LKIIVVLRSQCPSASKAFGSRCPGFMDVINDVWNGDINHAKTVPMPLPQAQENQKKIEGIAKVELHMALKIILWLDVAQES
jgi:hypothetical protein